MDGVAGARKYMDTSMEEEATSSKMQRREEEAPKWAMDLSKEFQELKLEVRGSVARVDGLVLKVEEIELKQEESNLRVQSVEGELASLRAENAEFRTEIQEIRGELKEQRGDLNDQIDRGLRDHVHFVGLPEPTREKSWEETTAALAKWLHQNLGKPIAYYDDAIWRAHRGPYDPSRAGPRPIFAQMKYRVAEEIKQKLKFEPKGGVRAKDQFCSDTQNRQNKALLARKEWKRENGGGFAYIAYPAVLKTKKAGESGYKIEKQF